MIPKLLDHVIRFIKMLKIFIVFAPVAIFIAFTQTNKTTLIITTDHGRGKRSSKWTEHDVLVRGSGDAWLAIIGPDTKPAGEMQLPQQLYQKQLASTISKFLGYNFTGNHPVAKSIDFDSPHTN